VLFNPATCRALARLSVWLGKVQSFFSLLKKMRPHHRARARSIPHRDTSCSSRLPLQFRFGIPMNPFLANTTFPIRVQPTVDTLDAMIVVKSGVNVPHQVVQIDTQSRVPSATHSGQGLSCHTYGYSWRCCTFGRKTLATFVTAGNIES
jgi:hypothetical protein